MKRYIVVALFLYLTSYSYSQMDEEISSYIDSTEIRVNNGRKLLIQSIENEDFERAGQIYDYLLELIDDETCSAFTFNEELMISSLTFNWSRWAQLTQEFQDYSKDICYANLYNIARSLYATLIDRADILKVGLIGLDPEDQEIIELYLLIFREGKVTDRYNEKYRHFRARFPESNYEHFLKEYLPSPTFKGSFGFSFGPNVLFPTANLGNQFSPNAVFSMGMDFNMNKIYASLFFSGGGLFLKEPVLISSGSENVEYVPEDRFAYIEGGLVGGYFLLRNNRFHIAPFLSISGGSLKSDLYEMDEDMEDLEFEIFNSFICGPGLHTELNVFEWKTKSPYYGGSSIKNHLSLKMDMGYNLISGQDVELFKGNFFYLRPTLVWGIGDF